MGRIDLMEVTTWVGLYLYLYKKGKYVVFLYYYYIFVVVVAVRFENGINPLTIIIASSL